MAFPRQPLLFTETVTPIIHTKRNCGGEPKILMEGLFRGKRGLSILNSDGAERKRNQKYGANRVERTLIEQWKTEQPWLLLSVL